MSFKKKISNFINRYNKENVARRNFYTRRQNILDRKKPVKSIAIIYFIPKTNSEKYNKWEDGFTKAVDLISEDFEVIWYNLEDCKPTSDELNQYDLVIAKSCWDWIVDDYVQSLTGLTAIKGIAVSCSKPPKNQLDLWRYDIIWYETFWYQKYVEQHPYAFFAFGINSDVFYPQNLEKTIDVLSIGAITSYKRFEKLNDEPGVTKLIIGSTNQKDYATVRSKLNENIKIIDYVSQEELATYINQSKIVYLPCELNGGGERAVLESISCGIPVKVESDNPKLTLLSGYKPFTKYDYYNSLVSSIKRTFDKPVSQTNLIKPSSHLIVGRYSFYNKNFKIKGQVLVTIGSFCSFGENVVFVTENHDTNYIATQGYLYRLLLDQDHPGEIAIDKSNERTKGPIHVGNDVWIGDNVFVMSGVSIGDGACIAAGSIVTKDVEPYTIVGGVPAKKIKDRFDKEVSDVLKDVKWWNWTDHRISQNKGFFNLNLNSTSVEIIKQTIK